MDIGIKTKVNKQLKMYHVYLYLLLVVFVTRKYDVHMKLQMPNKIGKLLLVSQTIKLLLY